MERSEAEDKHPAGGPRRPTPGNGFTAKQIEDAAKVFPRPTTECPLPRGAWGGTPQKVRRTRAPPALASKSPKRTTPAPGDAASRAEKNGPKRGGPGGACPPDPLMVCCLPLRHLPHRRLRNLRSHSQHDL